MYSRIPYQGPVGIIDKALAVQTKSSKGLCASCLEARSRYQVSIPETSTQGVFMSFLMPAAYQTIIKHDSGTPHNQVGLKQASKRRAGIP